MNCTSKRKVITEAVLVKADGTRITMGVISHNYSLLEIIKLKVLLRFGKQDELLHESIKKISIIKEIKDKLKHR
jgi:hypothetical protein